MSTKKNLSAKDLSEKFGVPVSEKDLNTEDGASSIMLQGSSSRLCFRC